MLKKGNEIKWTPEARKSFEEIKVALTKALVMTSPNFEKEFYCSLFPQSTPVGIGEDPGFNDSTTHQKNPNYWPFQQHLRSR
jgi:hypothetical protein